MSIFYKNGGFYDTPQDKSRKITNELYKSLIIGQSKGKQIVEDKNGTPMLADLKPSQYHTWDGTKWAISDEQQAVKNAEDIAKVRNAINALRDRKINGGVYVPEIDKWIDTDATAERNILSVKATFDLFGDALDIVWTCADNTTIKLDKATMPHIWQALMTNKQQNHANALAHKAAVEKSENPLEYNYSNGWTRTYEEYKNA